MFFLYSRDEKQIMWKINETYIDKARLVYALHNECNSKFKYKVTKLQYLDD